MVGTDSRLLLIALWNYRIDFYGSDQRKSSIIVDLYSWYFDQARKILSIKKVTKKQKEDQFN